jgi:class 3 adenylate cyclase
MTYAPDYDWAQQPEQRAANMSAAAERWGEGLTAGGLEPERLENDPEFREWAARLERLAASPGTIRRIFDLIGEFDVREVLPTIQVPTLVLYRAQPDFLDPRHSRYLAEHIPGARYVELEPGATLFELGDVDPLVDEIEEFLTGTRQRREPDRMLATVLFTDICGSTERAAQLGDARWRRVLEQHDTVVRRTLELHRGREIKRTGDGFLATFDGPARAIRAASTIAQSVRGLGIEVRAGLHTGECEVMNGDLGGLAVHIGSRVMDYARPSEVLVSSTVKDLVVGSGIDFEDRGQRELRGVPGEWRLWAVS